VPLFTKDLSHSGSFTTEPSSAKHMPVAFSMSFGVVFSPQPCLYS